LTVLSCGEGPTVAPARPRDLIVITIDTLRADRVGVNGSSSGATPALDALGRTGTVFLDAIRMNPALAVAHLELGRLAEARGDRATARTEYRLALDGDSTLTEARQALVRVGSPGQ
jgi:hypothetical protein